MSKSFGLVYNKMLNIIESLNLAKMSKEDAKDLLYDYLENSVAVEFKQCTKNLQDIVPPQSYYIEFNGNGITTDFNINIIPYDINYEVIVDGVTLEKDVDYTIDIENEIIHFNSTPITGESNIKISWSFDGQFNEDISNEEIYILALGNVLNWLQPQILRERNLKEAVGDRDYNRKSTANLLDKLLKVDETIRNNLRNYIRSYQYLNTESVE